MPRSRLQAVVATKEELIQKVGVYPGQLIKAWEESMHNTGIQLQLVQHALAEHPLHDMQGLHVAHLRLNQLYQGQQKKLLGHLVGWWDCMDQSNM